MSSDRFSNLIVQANPMADEDSLNQILATLGYAPQWLTYGFLTPHDLREQYGLFRDSADKHTEHYRYRTFVSILENNPHFTDEQVSQYITLTLLDSDRAMAVSALMHLLSWQILTTKQRNDIFARPELRSTEFRKIFEKHDIRQRIQTRTITEDEKHMIIRQGDLVTQRLLTEIGDLTEVQLEELAHRGKGRKTRNIAVARLQRLRNQAG
jgi:hypothetical protein